MAVAIERAYKMRKEKETDESEDMSKLWCYTSHITHPHTSHTLIHHHTSHTITPHTPSHLKHHHTSHTITHHTPHTPSHLTHLTHHHTSHTITPHTPHIPSHLTHHHTSHTITPHTPSHLTHHHTSHTLTSSKHLSMLLWSLHPTLNLELVFWPCLVQSLEPGFMLCQYLQLAFGWTMMSSELQLVFVLVS